jgi:hypothetical protein
MRRFSGSGGSLYALGERLTFTDQPLLNCGDGWDWRAPDELSHWVESPVITVIKYGEMIGVTPVEIHLPTGRVGLPCNMSHGSVLASGVCLPISWLVDGKRWEVMVETTVSETPSLGSDLMKTTAVIGNTMGVLYGSEVPIQNVLARFPLGLGVFTGIGSVTCHGPNSHIDFKEGVQYEPR